MDAFRRDDVFLQPADMAATGAYGSQFETPVDRAHRGQAKIRSRLIADLDLDDWHLPPKPKGMRWRTYHAYQEKFDRYEELIDYQCLQAAMRFLKFS
jgi:hypothetical protein